MINTAITTVLVSGFLLLLLMIIIEKERRRGRRFFFVGLRGWLDAVVFAVEQWLVRSWQHFTKFILQLNWYYSIHSVLRAILKMIVAVYTYFETIFENNRTRTKRLRAEKRKLKEKNHLQKMADHKKDLALTPAQQKKLKKQKLEDLH